MVASQKICPFTPKAVNVTLFEKRVFVDIN